MLNVYKTCISAQNSDKNTMVDKNMYTNVAFDEVSLVYVKRL